MSVPASSEEVRLAPLGDSGDEDESPPFDALELEIRRLPGVVAVGWHRGEAMRACLSVGGFGLSALRSRAVQLARGHLDEPLSVELSDVEGVFAASSAASVRIIDILVAGGEVEVRLGAGHLIGTGRAGTGPEGAALATIKALDDLGIGASIELRIASAVVLPSDLGLAVVVSVVDRHDGSEHRSIAYASSVEESAAKAVIEAYELIGEQSRDQAQSAIR